MNKKRNTLKKITGVGVIAGLAPVSWTKPIISSVILPAHAQTSMEGCITYFGESIQTDFQDITLSVLLNVCGPNIEVRLSENRGADTLSFVGNGSVNGFDVFDNNGTSIANFGMELENDPNPPGCAGTRGVITIVSISSPEIIFSYRNGGEIDAATRSAKAPIGSGTVDFGSLNEAFCRVENSS